MIGLRRKNILTYLNPDDHMMDMWQKDYVIQVDTWEKQWSGCSKTLMITARSSNSIGLRFRRSLLGLRSGRGSRRRQFLGVQGSRTGSNIGRCLKPLYVRMVGTTSRQLCSCFLTWTGCTQRSSTVTFHGIYSFPRDSFIVNISMHFGATLEVACSGCHSDLVPMKSVSGQAVCAVISMSSDVKA